MADHEMKQGDLLPSFRVALTSGGVALNLTGATVQFVMSTAAGGPSLIKAAMVVETPSTAGIVRYDWVAPNTANVGEYLAEALITWPGSKPQRAPTNAFWTIEINENLEV